jgi:tetratricopeptide (TPR) repeat protein
MVNINQNFPGKLFCDSMEKEVLKFEQEILRNPKDASAYAGLAVSYIFLWCYGFLSREDSIPKAKRAAMQAVEINNKIDKAHTALGIMKLSEWDWKGAEQEFKIAIKLSPENPDAHHWYALYLSAIGKHEQALKSSQHSLSLSMDPYSDIGYGSILYFAHQFDQMVELLEETVIKTPNYAPSFDWLGMAYLQLKQFDKSIEAYRRAVELSDGLAEIKAGLGHAYGMAGRKEEARKVLNELNSLAEKYYIPPVQIAYVAASLDEIDETFELLEKAYIERTWDLVFIREEPWFDDFHSLPRFVDLLKRIQFPRKE